MSGYRVNKVYIENFKLIDKVEIDFEKSDLIVFDGPNGYGKTTTFDAIELALTGCIKRIESNCVINKTKGFEHFLFHKDENKAIIIQVELVSDNDRISIVKRFDPQKVNQSMEKRPDYWDGFDTYLMKDYINPDDITEKLKGLQTVDRQSVSGFFHKNLNRYYDLFYYMQQEDHTSFLRMEEKERHERIEDLFDTDKELEEKEKVDEFKRRLEKIRDGIQQEVNELATKLNEIESPSINALESNLRYVNILKELDVIQEWDKEDFILSKENKEKIEKSLSDLERFIEYSSSYLNSQFNKNLNVFINDEKLIREAIIIGNWINSFDDIDNIHSTQMTLKKYSENLKIENIRTSIKDSDIDKLEQLVGGETDYGLIKSSMQGLRSREEYSSSISRTIDELNKAREAITDKFNKVAGLVDIKKSQCPLCGYDWNGHSKLLEQITKETSILVGYLDNNMKSIESDLKNLYETHVIKLIGKVNEKVVSLGEPINIDFYNQVKTTYKSKDLINQFLNWCLENKIKVNEYLNEKQEKKDVSAIDILSFKNYLKGFYKDIDKNYDMLDERTSFDTIFNSIFKGNKQNITKLRLDKVGEKKGYLLYKYFSSNEEKRKRITEEISCMKSKLDAIEKWIGNKGMKAKEKSQRPIYKITSIYETEISKHWRKLVTDVEIPFYIYSGKVIQTYQRGSGIFLQDPKSNKSDALRFLSDIDNDHDIVHSMSSGQLSAMIIAWVLTLNKVYGRSSGEDSLSILLIDDPVQTMDEINMASLVELLRNDFSDRQLIISTHEDNFSRYIRYKFLKYNLKEKRINVKDMLNS
ncbi:MAG TPA: AAA family ATPase [Clostridia bacterium]|nr:AAA family ATPase [Clostridia bacterium]